MTDDAAPGNGKYHEKIKHPVGKGFYPSFSALWHLHALGVADALDPFASTAWEAAGKTGRVVRVAVIDTPVAYRHPNLEGAIDLGLARDFSVFDEGAFVLRDVSDQEDLTSRAWLERMVEGATGALAEAIRAEIGGKDQSRFVPSPYGGHGTAIAGLIGARPATFQLRRPASLDGGAPEPESEVVEEPLPFAGINPFCRIVPISTTAAPYPEMVKGALDYARLIKAEVVVVAAEWADAFDRDQDACGWRDVDKALADLSARALVFCAAGNLKAPVLAYPASLSGEEGLPGLWAVTACDETGRLLSYAPDPRDFPGRQMLRGLSSEAPRFDREEVRLDPYAARDPDIRLPDPADDYPARHLVSTDPPGLWGYRPSPYEHDPRGGPGAGAETDRDVHYEIGSLFSRFSGTSAATAIAAGLASLALVLGPPETPPEATDPADPLLTLDLARRLFGRKGPD